MIIWHETYSSEWTELKVVIAERNILCGPPLEKSLFYSRPSIVLCNAADVVASLLHAILEYHLLPFLQVNDLRKIRQIIIDFDK